MLVTPPLNINFTYCFLSKFYFSYSVLENYKTMYDFV